ncbi:MAG: NACHT domain-containing NTPase [Phormidesmis sp.]
MIDIVEVVLVVLIAAGVAFLGNQLAEVPDFPRRNWLVLQSLVWLTVIDIVYQCLTLEEGLDERFKILLWCVGAVAAVLLVQDSSRLIAGWRGAAKKQGQGKKDDEPELEGADELRLKLLKDVRRQVRRRLKYAVGEQALINVAMQPDGTAVDAVGDEREGQVFLLPQAKQQVESFRRGEFRAVPSETTILDTFEDEDIDGLLLILGAPGMGKTTALLKLAESLLARAEETGEIPYIFELSAWRDPQQEIADWLMAQLKFDYGIDEKVSRGWILAGKLVPLLDGLDELPMAEQRGKTSQRLCVEKINEFVTAKLGQQVVVCCRYKEYEAVAKASGVKLDALNGALRLQPLGESQIQRYFEDMQRSEIWDALQDEAGLGKLMQPPERQNVREDHDVAPMKIPLFVQMLAVAYAPGKRLADKGELFDAYIERRLCLDVRKWDRRLARKKSEGATEWAYDSVEKEPELALTKRYLSWLARKLQENDSTNNFLIEQMQPSWLETTVQKWQYRLIFGLILGLILGLIFGLIFGLIGGLILGLIVGLIFGLENVETVETFQKISFSRVARKRMFREIRHGLILGLIVGLIFGLILGLIGGLIFGLIFGLIGGLKSDFQVRDTPNQGMIASAKNLLPIAMISYPAGVLLCFLPLFFSGSEVTFSESLIVGPVNALIIGFSLGGGYAVIQHATLRYLLHRQGHIPWNYARFLRYTTERRLTQQIGGRFRFIHRELLDHFDAMDSSQPPKPTQP